MTNPEVWEAIKRVAAEEGTDPYAALQNVTWFKLEGCDRCPVAIRPEGGHRCEDCGRDI